MKKLMMGVAAGALALGFASNAQAARFVVTYANAGPLDAQNSFASGLGALGLTQMTNDVGKTISVTGRARISFSFLGSESAFTDTFNWGGNTPGSAVESDGNHFPGGVFLGSTTLDSGGPLPVNFTTDGGINGLPASVGDRGFGIFLDANGGYDPQTLYFGYDDQSPLDNDDDDHDDFIVRATITAVPEPATWMTMIAGFGLIGFAARRRNARSLATIS